ncbi:MAG: hypothetical protein K9W43_13085 [Candidatus Thorarchaeota archaeon]|nr:hypothetical protein [Candidatus Thorarchaeota archaeon]
MMDDRKRMIREKIQQLQPGSQSPSGRYWCVTCKKMFRLDRPQCPYMTGMCVNTPIAIENLPPESTESLEKFGLFYPKIPQILMAEILEQQASILGIGSALAKTYLSFLKDWHVKYQEQPMQTLKSFILLVTGCETAQRVSTSDITFVILDVEKLWSKTILFTVLEEALSLLREELAVAQEIHIDSIEIVGNRDIGKYFCKKCGMFFEFGLVKDEVTCPLMSQKCMFWPQSIERSSYNVRQLLRVYNITPDIYARLFAVLEFDNASVRKRLRELLETDWHFKVEDRDLEDISVALGV